MKKVVVFALTAMLAFSLLLTGCSSTDTGSAVDESWDKVKNKGEIVLGLDASFPPMGYTDEKGEIVGFDIDVAKEVAKRLDIKLKLQPINWDINEQELNTGNVDMLWNGMTLTDARKASMLCSDPYMKNRQILVVKKDSGLKTTADLAGKNLALQSGSSAEEALSKAADLKDSLKDVVKFEDNMTALMDLEKGGVDVVLLDEIVARYYIKDKADQLVVLDESLADEEYGIGFRKNDKALAAKVGETLKAMAADGTLKQISMDWFEEDITMIGK